MTNDVVRSAVTFSCFLFALLATPRAHGESSRYNLRIDVAGMYPPGGLVNVGFDWQFKVGCALEQLFRSGRAAAWWRCFAAAWAS